MLRKGEGRHLPDARLGICQGRNAQSQETPNAYLPRNPRGRGTQGGGCEGGERRRETHAGAERPGARMTRGRRPETERSRPGRTGQEAPGRRVWRSRCAERRGEGCEAREERRGRGGEGRLGADQGRRPAAAARSGPAGLVGPLEYSAAPLGTGTESL